MSIDSPDSQDRDTLGRAANRYVTFQIVAAIIGGIVFLILLFTVFLPRFNRMEQAVTSSGPGMPGTSIGQGETSVTVDGRPATPEERRDIEQAINNGSK